ncbi:hypothetical protein FGG78_42075, partial [Thioclava sp. BHET1]
MRGQFQDAIPLLEHSLSQMRISRYELLTVSFSLSLARSLKAVGRLGEALEISEALIDRCQANNELLYLPEQLRLKAELLFEIGVLSPSGREELLLSAMEIASGQGAKFWELRIANDLARHLIKFGRADEASLILAPIFNSYEREFSIPDLEQAKEI